MKRVVEGWAPPARRGRRQQRSGRSGHHPPQIAETRGVGKWFVCKWAGNGISALGLDAHELPFGTDPVDIVGTIVEHPAFLVRRQPRTKAFSAALLQTLSPRLTISQ